MVIADMMGREVYSNTFSASGAIRIVPETEIAHGVYLLQVTSNGVTSQYKVVKQ